MYRRNLLFNRIPWIVLCVSLSLSLFATYMTQRQVNVTTQLRFDREAEKLRNTILYQMDSYISLLRGGVGLFDASDSVTRKEWKRYVQSLDLKNLYPGVQGFGFSLHLPARSLEKHEREIHEEGFLDYRVHPRTLREEYTSIIYLEPFDWRNQRAFGYDMFSEPRRQQAMKRARDTGQPSASTKVVLLQETERDPQPGFLVYLPVYNKDLPLNTPEERQAALFGYVYSPFRMNDLMTGINLSVFSGVRYQIYDGTFVSESSRLFSSSIDTAPSPPQWSKQFTLNIAGIPWTLLTESSADFEQESDSWSALIVFLSGLTESVLLFLISLTLIAKHKSALLHTQQLSERLELQQKLGDMTNVAPIALLSVDAHGNIDMFNREACQLFGYDSESLRGVPLAKVIPCEASADPTPSHPSAHKDADQVQSAPYCLTQQGNKIAVDIAIADTVTISGHYRLLAVKDITSRKQQEEILRKKSKELEQFVYAVSHDLKSPLVSLRGFTAQLEKRESLQNDEKASHYVKRINANLQMMDVLIKDLLDLSRVTNKALEYERIDLNLLLITISDQLHGLIQQANATINIQPELPFVHGQTSMISQLFTNLLSNAIKYRAPGRPPCIEVGLKVANHRVGVFYVKDNGIGIKEQYHSRVFDIFERIEVENNEGTGVGLSICKTVVERHGGHIWLQSTYNEGTTFYFELPLQHSLSGSTT
ncbi:MAG: CHASE domain-containing protein [Hahellaceae bacterium]|nr:CHASE domain-containing protein [Hahellaceae bacterium]